MPLVPVHDDGMMHRDGPVNGLLGEFDQLIAMHALPPYTPMFNPVEELWNWTKYDELANFTARDIPQLDAVLNDWLFSLHRNQQRLRTFLQATPLQW